MKNMVKSYYSENFSKYGISSKSLGWTRGKQTIRFDELTKNFNLEAGVSILDIGCGFGDFNVFLRSKGVGEYLYVGVDIMDEFVDVARDKYKDSLNVSFVNGDFRKMDLTEKFDYIIGSGIFNVNLKDEDNYDMVEEIMRKAFSCCKEEGALSFDFQSDKVDYKSDSEYAFYYSPGKILDIAYSLSRNIILNNTYFPFEFAITVFKNDSFDKESITFNRYLLGNH